MAEVRRPARVKCGDSICSWSVILWQVMLHSLSRHVSTGLQGYNLIDYMIKGIILISKSEWKKKTLIARIPPIQSVFNAKNTYKCWTMITFSQLLLKTVEMILLCCTVLSLSSSNLKASFAFSLQASKLFSFSKSLTLDAPDTHTDCVHTIILLSQCCFIPVTPKYITAFPFRT